MSMAGFSAAIALLALFFVLLVTAFVFSQRYIKVGPNEVLVISGRKRTVTDPVTGETVQRNFRLLKGGGTFIVPVLERVDELSLELMTIDVVTRTVEEVRPADDGAIRTGVDAAIVLPGAAPSEGSNASPAILGRSSGNQSLLRLLADIASGSGRAGMH